MALELEVEVKTQKLLDKEDLEEMDTNRVIGKPLMEFVSLSDETKFEYRRLRIKLDQLDSWGDFDGVHTVLYLPYGTFLANIPYDRFNGIYTAMTSIELKRVSDFQIIKTPKPRGSTNA